MASESSSQFREPVSHPQASDVLHASSNTGDSTVKTTGTADAKQNSTSSNPPPMDRQSSMGKIAQVAKHLVKSPAEEIEHRQLEKTLSKEAKKGSVDVSVMEA